MRRSTTARGSRTLASLVLASLVVASLALARPALAQDDGACAAVWDRITAELAVPLTADPVTAEPDGWCAVASVGFDSGRTYAPVFSAEAIRWRIEGIDRFLADLTPPSALDLQVLGLRQSTATGDALLDYLMRVQQVPQATDARLTLRWDAESRVLSLDDFAVDFPGDNALTVTAKLADIDLSSVEALEASLMSARLTSLSSDLQSNGLFESLILWPLGNELLSGSGDPEADVVALKDLARTEIAAIPDSVLAEAGRTALTALVDQMPNPAGTLGLRLTSAAGFDLTRLMPLVAMGNPPTRQDVWGVFDGVAMDILFTPTPDPRP